MSIHRSRLGLHNMAQCFRPRSWRAGQPVKPPRPKEAPFLILEGGLTSTVETIWRGNMHLRLGSSLPSGKTVTPSERRMVVPPGDQKRQPVIETSSEYSRPAVPECTLFITSHTIWTFWKQSCAFICVALQERMICSRPGASFVSYMPSLRLEHSSVTSSLTGGCRCARHTLSRRRSLAFCA